MRLGLLVAVGCLGILGAGPASAAAARFTLDYEAPAGCPSREAFLEAVRDRVPGAEESKQEGSFAFRVTIEATGELFRGRVELGEAAPEREVVPAPCADVASSMAIMIAMVLSGDAREREAERASPAPVPERTPAATESAAPIHEKSRPSQRRIEPVGTPPQRPAGTPSERVLLRGGAWGAAGISDGVAPFPAIALSGGAELWVDWVGRLRPSARAGALYVTGDTTVDGLGGAEFRLSGLVGRVCPHTFSLAARWSLAACASFEIGELTARGVSTPNRRVQRMPWLSFGVAPRAELALGRVVSLEAEVGLRGIVRHDRFVFEPEATEVYDVPRFAPHLALGASARFP